MSQNFPPIDSSLPAPPGDTGTSLAIKLNDWQAAILSMHSGSSRPSYATAGTLWRDTAASPWVIKIFDGTSDVSLFNIDPATHKVTKVFGTAALEALEALTPATDRLPYFTSASAAAVTPITAFARTLLDDSNAEAMRDTIEVFHGAFPTGTKMLFVQDNAPTGWTKDVDQNNKALRIVSGNAGTGGSVSFSGCFDASRSTSSVALGPQHLPPHFHQMFANVSSGGGGVAANEQVAVRGNIGSNHDYLLAGAGGTAATVGRTSSIGSGAGHGHQINIDVQYVDVIKCTKT